VEIIGEESDMTTTNTVVVTGGGSGGHITPILAVARELKRLSPATRVVYISHSGDNLDDVVSEDKNIDEMYSVRAGKFRRYNGEGWQQLLDFRTMYLNIRDGIQVLAGLWQSFWLLRRLQPRIIFTRGSYVSVPVCLASAVRHIPYVTHDSDAIPSLTNRLIAHWALLHAVALPEELYPYPIDKTVTVGVPISHDFQLVTDTMRRTYKKQLQLESYNWVLLITGGGLGAQRLNSAVVDNAAQLLRVHPGLAIVHLTGRAHETDVKAAYAAVLSPDARRQVFVKGFVTDMYRYTGSANVVIARGGATNLAELAVQAKTCIIVPNPLLTGGHQLKNTAALSAASAIIEMTEDQMGQELRLASVVADLLDNPDKAAHIAAELLKFARPNAAERLAVLLLQKARPVTSILTPADGSIAT
jgi:UDP-N-acetylglucosamine--N-acetylmuramyl-(pentapeptide) pyrophosphoryl-undecaprenol N-acetylglucosamine transferase